MWCNFDLDLLSPEVSQSIETMTGFGLYVTLLALMSVGGLEHRSLKENILVATILGVQHFGGSLFMFWLSRLLEDNLTYDHPSVSWYKSQHSRAWQYLTFDVEQILFMVVVLLCKLVTPGMGTTLRKMTNASQEFDTALIIVNACRVFLISLFARVVGVFTFEGVHSLLIGGWLLQLYETSTQCRTFVKSSIIHMIMLIVLDCTTLRYRRKIVVTFAKEELSDMLLPEGFL
jgi:hypothetical protein